MAETATLDLAWFDEHGYTVEVHDDGDEDGRDMVPYTVYGQRGAEWLLIRNVPKPHMLFVSSTRARGRSLGSIRGFTWFTDEGGRLRPVS